MNDFDIDKSRWYNLMKLGLASKGVMADAETIISRARHLGGYAFDPVALTQITQAENALTEALFAVKVAREEYQRAGKPALQAAE